MQQELTHGSNDTILGIFGAGGFAKEVLPIAKEHFSLTDQSNRNPLIKIYFVEIEPNALEINGFPVISEDDFFKLQAPEKFFNVAIGDSKLREKVAINCAGNGVKPLTLRAKNTVIYDNNQIGEGAIICAYSVITSDAKIGKFFHSNLYSYVAHDCVIGNYVTFAPNVHCNGHVHIQNHAYIGTGAIIKPGVVGKPLVIGEGAIVGMGAVVTKNVEPYTTVIGNPANPFQKQ